jgi:hypothetical protein
MERLKPTLLSLLLFMILLASINEPMPIALAQSSPLPAGSNQISSAPTPKATGIKLPLLLLSGGVGVAIGAIAAGFYCYTKYKQQAENLAHQLNSSKGKYTKTEAERKRLEEQYLILKRDYSILENERNDLERKFSHLQSVNQRSSDRQSFEGAASNFPTSNPSQFLAVSEANPALSPMEKLLQAYQTNSKSLQPTAKVTEAPESIDQRRNNPSLAPSLVESGNFDYLIIEDEDNANQFWLLPKHGLKVNQYAYETVQALFDCYNYQNQPSNFQVRKPASVIHNPASSSWQLTEKGEIEFV